MVDVKEYVCKKQKGVDEVIWIHLKIITSFKVWHLKNAGL